jgi:hypothetical protein
VKRKRHRKPDAVYYERKYDQRHERRVTKLRWAINHAANSDERSQSMREYTHEISLDMLIASPSHRRWHLKISRRIATMIDKQLHRLWKEAKTA